MALRSNHNLAVKYRPKDWEDVCEQDSIVKIFKHVIENQTCPNVMLFCGPSGCGKTTAARIVANQVNGGQGSPIEIDAASNSGVDNVRDIIEQSKFKSLDSEYKVYIIDECFSADTLIKTKRGHMPISRIKVGDTICNMAGHGIVQQVIINSVPVDRLVLLQFDDRNIVTTQDHLFFTEDGWVEAAKLLSDQKIATDSMIADITKNYKSLLHLTDKTEFNVDIQTKVIDSGFEFSAKPKLAYILDKKIGGWQFQEEVLYSTALALDPNLDKAHIKGIIRFHDEKTKHLFLPHIDAQQLDSGYVEMYDLSVSGHPSYFAEGVLVHNCHALSNGAWQAFLKLLEEPPAKTYYVFCTTAPEKIPNTIHSRIQRFDFHRITYKTILNRLIWIVDQENQIRSDSEKINTEPQALEYIAKISNGGMRDAITSLDKCLSYSRDLNVKNVTSALSAQDYDIYFNLIDYILAGDSAACIDLIEKIYLDGQDLKLFIRQYVAFLLDLCKFKLIQNYDYIQIPATYVDRLKSCLDYDFGRINDVLSHCIKLNGEMRWEAAPKVLIEASLIDWCLDNERPFDI